MQYFTPLRRFATALALVASTSLIGVSFSSGVSAQAIPGIVLIDVMIINDDGGSLTNPEVGFSHTNNTGQDTETSGTDDDPVKCLSSDAPNCHIADGPIGPGSVTVPPIDGYTIDIQCVAEFPPSTATGATFDLADGGEVYCVVMLDDIEPTVPTSSTTTTTTTTTPTTTIAPTTTLAPTTTAAPPTAPPSTPDPTTELPSTGLDDTGTLTLVAFALLVAGIAATGLTRRRA